MENVKNQCLSRKKNTLSKFSSSALKSYRAPIGKDRLKQPSIFQGRTVKLQGSTSFSIPKKIRSEVCHYGRDEAAQSSSCLFVGRRVASGMGWRKNPGAHTGARGHVGVEARVDLEIWIFGSFWRFRW